MIYRNFENIGTCMLLLNLLFIDVLFVYKTCVQDAL